jgi:hypothetical protein
MSVSLLVAREYSVAAAPIPVCASNADTRANGNMSDRHGTYLFAGIAVVRVMQQLTEIIVVIKLNDF